jgi:hypothetical protein
MVYCFALSSLNYILELFLILGKVNRSVCKGNKVIVNKYREKHDSVYDMKCLKLNGVKKFSRSSGFPTIMATMLIRT